MKWYKNISLFSLLYCIFTDSIRGRLRVSGMLSAQTACAHCQSSSSVLPHCCLLLVGVNTVVTVSPILSQNIFGPLLKLEADEDKKVCYQSIL